MKVFFTSLTFAERDERFCSYEQICEAKVKVTQR